MFLSLFCKNSLLLIAFVEISFSFYLTWPQHRKGPFLFCPHKAFPPTFGASMKRPCLGLCCAPGVGSPYVPHSRQSKAGTSQVPPWCPCSSGHGMEGSRPRSSVHRRRNVRVPFTALGGPVATGQARCPARPSLCLTAADSSTDRGGGNGHNKVQSVVHLGLQCGSLSSHWYQN